MVVFMNSKTFFFLSFLYLTILIPGIVKAQISAPGKSGSDKTNYPVFNETDSIYVFCTAAEGEDMAVLRGNTNWSGTKTFLWEKYNPGSAYIRILFF